MSDRTYVSITVHPEDMSNPAWQAFLDKHGESEDGENPNDWASGDCDYALHSELADLGKSAVRFFGSHDSGYDYSAHCFFSDSLDEEVHYSRTWDEGAVTVEMNADGSVAERALDEARALFLRYREVERSAVWR